jgi:hypothetical protein
MPTVLSARPLSSSALSCQSSRVSFNKSLKSVVLFRPNIFEGHDVIAQAQSGTGKTATFSISVLQKLDPNIKQCQALILAPTRELAQQIQKVVVAIGDFMNVECHACIGGTSVRDDMKALQEGPQVVVGTPGRVQDMIQRRFLKTDSMKMFVLDEADEMLSVSLAKMLRFLSDANKIFSADSLSKSTTSSNSCLNPPRSSFSPPPCLRMFSRLPPNLCATLYVSWSRRPSLPSKVSNNFTSPLRRRIGNWTPSLICTRLSLSHKQSSSATPEERSIGLPTSSLLVTSLSPPCTVTWTRVSVT